MECPTFTTACVICGKKFNVAGWVEFNLQLNQHREVCKEEPQKEENESQRLPETRKRNRKGKSRIDGRSKGEPSSD